MDRAARQRAFDEALLDFLSTADPSQSTFELPEPLLEALIELESFEEPDASAEPAS